jgi:DMSO/TMAO reductase YedYZ molybdopterin-dependent catalytic subunit
MRSSVRARGGSAGVAAGVAGAGAGLLVGAAVHTAAPHVPFPPIEVAQTVARLTPGGVASTFIDLLHHLALPLTVVLVTIGTAAVAAGLGALLPRLAPRVPGGTLAAAGLLSAPLYAVAIEGMRPDATTVDRGTYGLILIPVFAVSALVVVRTFERLTLPAAPADASRRAVSNWLALGGVGLALGWLDLGRILFPRPDPGRNALHVADLATPVSAPPPDPAFDAIPRITPRITPLARHYVVDEEIIDPDVDPATWRLRVGGAVDHPFALTYQQLVGLPAAEQFQTLECISNPVGGDLMSTAVWTGIPMRDLLGRAGVRAGAVEVVSSSIGGYSDSITLEQAMRPTTLIAFGMDGHVLPRAHGFPARLLVPGLYGMKQPKWLEAIGVVDRPYVGYWEQRGWIKAAVVKTTSRIDGGGIVSGTPVLAGVAFAGDRGVSKVEVSADGGRTWEVAELEAALSGFTWRRWRLAVNDTRPGIEFTVRATDGRGVLQPSVTAPPHPSGASGFDVRTVDVSA